MPSDTMLKIAAVIFDLDGVIVDTAQFHYIAWKTLAKEWDYELGIEKNEQLKGVSRKESVAKIALWAGVRLPKAALDDVASRKNKLYLELCAKLTPSDVLPGIANLITELKDNNIKTALGSASKNARFVIGNLGLSNAFDVIVDGNDVLHSKPNPEVFLKAATLMNLPYHSCVVIEDAPAGIQAAIAAQMIAVGLGDASELHQAHFVIPNTKSLTLSKLKQLYQQILT